MFSRMIAPNWLSAKGTRKVLEGDFTHGQIQTYNNQGYNVYYLPNHPRNYPVGVNVDGSLIDAFNYCFIDYDCKTGTYDSKEGFIEAVSVAGIKPTSIVDSGNGIHVFWNVIDLDAISYLRLTRRLMRLFSTDPAVGQIFQLMRMPGTLNTKNETNFVPCELLYESMDAYTCEELDKLLPSLTMEDEQHCKQHYDKTYNIQRNDIQISDKMPLKFAKLISENQEAKTIWGKVTDDRSRSDYRLAHIMFANDFKREEALTVLANSPKALERAPVHRLSYATNIVDKIWTFELLGEIPEEDADLSMSDSVESILTKSGSALKGTPFRCHPKVDNTVGGFRLGQVLGLVAGVGVGKTAFAMNVFRWFAQKNPDYHHFFIPLEQPANEIADRWKTMAGSDTSLHSKVHIMSNYDSEGNYRHLSFDEIKDYLNKWQKVTGKKIGCVVIDHIGVLKKQGAKDSKQDIETICHQMKAFAVQTNTFLIMQSQTSRAKAGIGDLELDKDAAYGTTFFEAYCDFMVTLWQPLKRCHAEPSCPTVTAYKFCKIRHKKAKQDVILEDVAYFMKFDSDRELLEPLNQDEVVSFNYFLDKATKKRGQDAKTKTTEYSQVGVLHEVQTNISNHRRSSSTR